MRMFLRLSAHRFGCEWICVFLLFVVNCLEREREKKLVWGKYFPQILDKKKAEGKIFEICKKLRT